MSKEQHIAALKKATDAGDYQAANEIAAFIDTNYPDEMSAGEIAQGVVGTAGQMAAATLAEPVAGLAGIAGSILPGEQGQGAQWVQNVQQSLTPTPSEETQKIMGAMSEYIPDVSGYIGGKTLELTGSPELATLAYTAPEAVMQWLGLRSPALAAKLAKRGERLTANEASLLREELEKFKGDRATTEGIETTAQALQQATESPGKVAELAEFDAKILKAADDLGFQEIPPSIAAGNAQFRDISQGLASMPGSTAKAQYTQFVNQMANKADEIIIQGGGDLDKAAVSQRFVETTNNIHKNLSDAETNLYNQIEAKVTPAAPVNINETVNFVDEKLVEFGGYDKMPNVYKDIYNLVYDADGNIQQPTYAAFNQKRKDIGAAIGKKSSPYSDSERGVLKSIYAPMKADQKNITDELGAGELQTQADDLTVRRKALEDTTVDLLGKKLNKDLMPTVATKIAGLPKGDVTKFIKTIEGIPENMRQEVVVSALNDLLKGSGADQKAYGAARFVGLMNQLNRSPTAKAALYKHLPEQTQTALDNFYELANANYKANKENITTGKISTFFPDTRGMLNNLMGKAASALITTKFGSMAAEGADSVVDFMRNETPSAKKANDLISGKNFQAMMREAVRDGVHEGGVISEKTKRIEKMVEKSESYKKWKETLDGNQSADLAAFGLVNYLNNAGNFEEEAETK